ncbi:AAA family ATPase [Synechococcus sp. J7-Johnson]|uniref:bifunctional aminoglycoside phosphotransferase/ATP-binding protein n=1 Tax=Synechococcus sp. J7-Johnson TaxID=2823737 RepID=UPI0020CE3720|nr:bifunctional aminoglycoside phosphotransferase/ATP-binding protein [Synechococcus sp. J7-Johnson]MCP9840112.1 AAA family ATPase [Synechococcus sp. J7-Johnson]
MTSATPDLSPGSEPGSSTPLELAALISALSRPGAYPDEAWGEEPADQRRVELIQTHISVVFLTSCRAFKLKKPLRFWGLLDYGSAERRLHWCREEVRLNSRLAPDLYLGVAAVLQLASGEVRLSPLGEELEGGEHVVVMHRFAAAATLAAHLAADRVSDMQLEQLGRFIARFHNQYPLAPELAFGAEMRFAAVLRNNVRATRRSVPELFPPGVHGLLVSGLALALRRSRFRLRQRLAAGQAVDGHGDLRLEHVLLEPQLAVVDGVEFNADLRQVDRASDLAFLVMDLQAAGHGDRVEALLAGYGQAIEPAVLQLFCAYRAHVRAKVEAATSGEQEIPVQQRQAARAMARRYLSLALAYVGCGLGPPALILLHGLSGSGKSHLAARLAPWLLADHQRSDLIRKRLYGLTPLQRPSGEQRHRIYSPDAHQRTEDALLAAAEASLRQGRWVLLDATHLRAGSRERAIQLARRVGAVPLLLEVRADQALLQQRLERRERLDDDPSDADLAVLLEQRRTAEPLSSAEQLRSLVVHSHQGLDESMVLMELWECWERAAEADLNCRSSGRTTGAGGGGDGAPTGKSPARSRSASGPVQRTG